MDIAARSELGDTFVALHAALDDVLDRLSNSESLPIERQIAQAQQLEKFANRWSQVNLAIMAGLDRSDAATALCQGQLTRVLTSALGISRAEAARRVHGYEQLGPRRTMLGEELGAIRPHVTKALAAGEVSMEKALIITRALKPIDRAGFDPLAVTAGEKLLVDDARVFNPEDLRILAQRVVDSIDPDGTKPQEELSRDRRWWEMTPTADGGYTGRFRLTGECGAKLAALLHPLSKPRVDNFYGDGAADSSAVAVAGAGSEVRARRATVVDERTYGQRQHDALEDLCDRLLREGTVRDNGNEGPPVTLIVTVGEAELTRRTGHAVTTTGGLLSNETTLRLADQADVFAALLSKDGVPLKLARQKRCATRHQTMALIARDLGCSFPGCAHPADYCERHHVVPWIDGGRTDLDNLTLLCIYHHHNFLQRGWAVTINDQGLPEWRPPRWVDPDQQPLINNRIRAAHRSVAIRQ